MDPFDRRTLGYDLSAFADGELDAAAARRLLQHMLDDPSAADALRQVQQLSVAARRVVRSATPPVPDDLRYRLQQIAMPAGRPPARPALAGSPAGWWLASGRAALAAAVLLAVGVWVGRHAGRTTGPVSFPNPGVPAAEVLPAEIVAGAEEVHGVCSRLAIGLHSAGYPADVAALPTAVEQDLHSDHPYPDLSPIGYRYRGAGPCGKPLPDTAHLLYRSVAPGSVNAVSVFVQPWHDQYPLAPGRLYTVSVAQSPFPMLAWRTDRVVYFLLADNAATERSALRLIRGAPTTAPSPATRP